jgi:hypothetical protein
MCRIFLVAALAAAANPAHASEVFGGVLVHDIDSPFTMGGLEDGADFQLGWRGKPIGALRAIGSPSPYMFGSVHTDGGTHFAAAGISWKIGGRVFLRPGLGVAVHTRGSNGVANGFRTDLGSRVLFEPELGIGLRISDHSAIEATWVHISNAQLLSSQNPGMDSVGIRLSHRLR